MALRSDVLPSALSAAAGTTLPSLSRALLNDPLWHPSVPVVRPREEVMNLPERAVQFGTGAFLRGFVEYFLDEANAQGRFNGRIVLVGSTASGRDRAFTTQDGLFTLQSTGAEPRDNESRIVASVSRALSATAQWNDVLLVARQREISVVFSNTTEAGYALNDADISLSVVPQSFPAKLTRFLYERARAFSYDPTRGVVVIPCELLDNNGDVLKALVHSVADRWRLEPEFREWLDASVPFCNTLVDRIVPGAPPAPERQRLELALGYTDDLLTVAESYRLFVIEVDAALRARLPFLEADRGVIMTDNIRAYRERKVRLLNGTHTALAAVGILAGLETVDAAMRDDAVSGFARGLLLAAIAPVVDAPDARAFGEEVLRRFANPHVHHRLTDIANHGTLKLRVRLLPVVRRYVVASHPVPQALIVAFAAQLVLLHPHFAVGHTRSTDDLGTRVRAQWDATSNASDAIKGILSDTGIWNEDLTHVSDFAERVAAVAIRMLAGGVRVALQDAAETSVAEINRASSHLGEHHSAIT